MKASRIRKSLLGKEDGERSFKVQVARGGQVVERTVQILLSWTSVQKIGAGLKNNAD